MTKRREAIEISIAVGLAVAVFVGMLVVGVRLSTALDERVDTGERVTGTVRDEWTLWFPRRLTHADVSYGYRGDEYATTLVWYGPPAEVRNLDDGDPIELYVDPSDPRRVATPTEAGSEGWLMVLPAPLAVLLIVGIGVVAGRRAKHWPRVMRASTLSPVVALSPAGAGDLPPPPRRSTLYRHQAWFPGTVALVVAGGLVVEAFPHPPGWPILLICAPTLLYGYLGSLGAKVTVRPGLVVVDNPVRRHRLVVADLERVEVEDDQAVFLWMRDGTRVEVVAMRSLVQSGRTPALRVRARRLAAMIDAVRTGATDVERSVTSVRVLSTAWIVALVAATVVGLALLVLV